MRKLANRRKVKILKTTHLIQNEGHFSQNFDIRPDMTFKTTHLLHRYGDRCPQSIPANIFAMVWSLIGLIIFAIFMGSLASILTVTIVQMDSGDADVTDDGKVMNVLSR